MMAFFIFEELQVRMMELREEPVKLGSWMYVISS
jgi:hypothetical protein